MKKKLVAFLTAAIMTLATGTTSYANALSDFQAAQAQAAAITAQIQQVQILAATDPAQALLLQSLQAQLLQIQQLMATLQPAAAQELQQQQAAAIQAQQAAMLQAQQQATLQAQQQAMHNSRSSTASAGLSIPNVAASGGTVYVASSGEGSKYHRTPNCRSLTKGATPLALSQAQAMGRTPCGICY